MKFLIIISLFLLPATGVCQSRGRLETITALQSGKSVIMGVRFSPDEKTLLAASLDGTLQKWDLETGKSIWTAGLANILGLPRGTVAETVAVDSSIRDNWAISYSKMLMDSDGRLHRRVYGIALLTPYGRLVRALDLDDIAADAVQLSPDGGRIAYSSGSSFCVRDSSFSGPPKCFSTKDVPVSMSFSPNGELLAVASSAAAYMRLSDELVQIFDTRSGRIVAQGRGTRRNIDQVLFSPLHDDVAVISQDSRGSILEMMGLVNGKLEPRHEVGMGSFTRMAFSPAGESLAWISSSRKSSFLSLTDPTSMKSLRTYSLSGQPRSIAFSKTGRFIGVGCTEGRLFVVSKRS